MKSRSSSAVLLQFYHLVFYIIVSKPGIKKSADLGERNGNFLPRPISTKITKYDLNMYYYLLVQKRILDLMV